MMMNLDLLGQWRAIDAAAGVALLVVAACRDLTSRTIPDWISVALAAVGLGGRAVLGPWAIAASVAVAVALFLILALAHARGALGGGDVKLLSSAAFGFSPIDTCHMLIGTAFAGGLLAAVHLVARRMPRTARSHRGASRGRRLWTIEKWRWQRKDCLPYAVAIAIGGSWTMLSGMGT